MHTAYRRPRLFIASSFYVLLPAVAAFAGCTGNIDDASAYNREGVESAANLQSTCPAAIDGCHIAGTYDTATRACSAPQAVADGTACDDGDMCTTQDTCQKGICTAGTAKVCPTNNACETATCDPIEGCQTKPLDALCNSTLTAEPLNGCWISTYGAPVTVGGTKFNLMFDTGSNMFAVAGGTCDDCGTVSPLYLISADSNYAGAPAFTQSYGDGSNWLAVPIGDTVQVDSSVGPVKMNFAYIGDVNQTGQHAFFQHGDCDTGAVTYNNFQGIMGAGSNNAPGFLVDNFLAALQTSKNKLPDALSVQLCERGGFVWYGGYDRTHMHADPQWMPMQIDRGFYDVQVADIEVNGTPMDLDANTLAVLDTGTSAIQLTQNTFSAVTRAIENDPNFLRLFGATFLDTIGNCVAPPAGMSRAELDAVLPHLTFSFRDINDKTIHMDMEATHSYLTTLGSSAPTFLYCSALQLSSETIIGDAGLQSHTLVFDRANKKVGIAPQQGCPAPLAL